MKTVIYKDGEDYVAHDLDMDLIGCGKGESDARKELEEMVKAQVEFAASIGDPSIIRFPSNEAIPSTSD